MTKTTNEKSELYFLEGNFQMLIAREQKHIFAILNERNRLTVAKLKNCKLRRSFY